METLLEGNVPRLLQTWRAHGAAGEITCMDVTCDGARLLTAGGDRAVRYWVWQVGEGWIQAGVARQAHRYGVTAVAWSRSGALAASGGVDGAARVWAASSLAARRLLAAPGAAALRSLCWAATGMLLCGHDDGAVYVWYVRDASLAARLHAHDGALHAVTALADGALLLTACTDGVLKVFDMQNVVRAWRDGNAAPSPLLWEDGAHDLGTLCCAASQHDAGMMAATGGQDTRVRLWVVSGVGAARCVTPGVVLCGHGAAITALRWSASRLLASASLDRTARVWAAHSATCLLVLHAHPRYLTSVALAPDLRYLITGSNDKTVRMWSLGDLDVDCPLEVPCEPLAHFGVGDLEGIEPLEEEVPDAGVTPPAAVGSGGEDAEAAGASRLAYRNLDIHTGAVNCIAVSGNLLATACSDGVARLFRWSDSELSMVCEFGERGYPTLAVELCPGGTALLAAGLDGSATLWDVESGCLLRAVSVSAGEGGGGGGVRAARLSRDHPPRLLLATDDGTAPVWSLADSDPDPLYVFEGPVEGATCCAWSACGRVLAVGGAGGELRVMRSAVGGVPRLVSDVHDIAVQSCDFGPLTLDLPLDALLLATVGCDDFIKLWRVDIDGDGGADVSVVGAGCAHAHGGGASSVRWGEGGMLVSGGADGWARVWRAESRGTGVEWRLQQLAALPAVGAVGIPAAVIIEPSVVALGSLAGELAVWRVPVAVSVEDDEDLEPRWWGPRGVARWLREYVTRAPDTCSWASESETALVSAACDAQLDGARLMDAPEEHVLTDLQLDEDDDENPVDEGDVEDEDGAEGGMQGVRGTRGVRGMRGVRARLLEELRWIRRGHTPEHLCVSCEHALQCPLTHCVLREPARAADGITYERANLHEWFLANEGAVSYFSGRTLHSARVCPNYGARAALARWLREHDALNEEDTLGTTPTTQDTENI